MGTRNLTLLAVLGLALAGCGDRFSPDSYATRAVQQADKVEQGIVVGVRQVRISAEGTVGAATGAAAGGVIGAQAPGGGIVSALGGVGGALVGGILGRGAESAIVDANAYEYIVRTTKNELMRVTQQDREPLRRGQQVLLITGTQARVVPDYTVTANPADAPGAGPSPRPPAAAAAAASHPPAAGAPPSAGPGPAATLPPLPAAPPVVPAVPPPVPPAVAEPAPRPEAAAPPSPAAAVPLGAGEEREALSRAAGTLSATGAALLPPGLSAAQREAVAEAAAAAAGGAEPAPAAAATALPAIAAPQR